MCRPRVKVMAISIHYIAFFFFARALWEADRRDYAAASLLCLRPRTSRRPARDHEHENWRKAIWLYSNVRWARGTCFLSLNLTDNHLSWWTVRDLLCVPDSMQFSCLFIGFRMSPCFPPRVLLTGRETKQKATFHVCVIPKHNYWYFSQKNTHSHSFFCATTMSRNTHTYI